MCPTLSTSRRRRPEARERPHLIGKDRDTSFLGALAAAGLSLRAKDFALRTDSDAAYLAALRAGVGIGICQVPLGAGPPRLRRVLPKIVFELPVWIVTHEDLRASRRVCLVFEHLVASLATYVRSSAEGRSKR